MTEESQLAGVNLVEVGVEYLREPANNPNHMGADELARLTAAIRRFGFLQPVLVRERLFGGSERTGCYEIVDGVHRVRAAKAAGLTALPCVVVGNAAASDAHARALQIGMNKLRGELNLSDVAAAIAELVDAGWTTSELTVTGYSEDELDELVKVATTDDTTDALEGASASAPEDAPDKPPKPFVLELEFATRAELTRVKKVLRRAAGGRGRPLSDGLLALVEGS